MLHNSRRLLIHQYYMNDYRHRSTSELMYVNGTLITITNFERIKKIKIGTGHNMELEIEEISEDTFKENENNNDLRHIHKNRYIYPYDNRMLEIDVFEDMRLVIMEVEDVELTDIINFPPEIEREILMEVTGISAFDNYNLAG